MSANSGNLPKSEKVLLSCVITSDGMLEIRAECNSKMLSKENISK